MRRLTLVEDFLEDQRKLLEIYVGTMPLTGDVHLFPYALNYGGLYRTIFHYDFYWEPSFSNGKPSIAFSTREQAHSLFETIYLSCL